MYLAIEGVIGVGKTTLARLLQPAFQAELYLEVFEENPFLSDFYADRQRYAFQTQIFFLLSRYHQQRRISQLAAQEVIQMIADYTFAKDSLFARINLMGDDYIEELNQVYDRFFADSHYQGVPVLRIDTDNLNYVRNPDDLKWVENRIRQALKMAPFQPELPLGAD